VPTDEGPAITRAGSYLPRFRVDAGRSRVVVRNGDEDALTLAVEAAQDCVGHADVRVDEVMLAVARPELVDGPGAEVVREALGLPADTATATMAGDALAGLSALFAARDAVAAGRAGSVLVIASEPGDGVRVGAASVALLVTRPADTPAIRLLGHRAVGDVVYGNWVDSAGDRHHGDGRFLEHRLSALASRAVTELGPPAMSVSGLVPGPVSAVSVVTGVAAASVAKACRAVSDGGRSELVLADYGVAGPLLALLAAAGGAPGGPFRIVASTASRVLAVAGRADPGAPSWSVPSTDRAEPPTEPESSPPLSLPTSSPFFNRAARELLRLEGARCRDCGTVAFPPSQRPICAGCQGDRFDPVPLSRTGSVHTYVVNRFLPSGFGEQMALVLGDLDGGGRYWAPTSGMRPDDLAIGLPVELRLRRFTGHGGAPAYAMKFVARRSETLG
jgi:uncharacterized OB-fold protein